jgi:hypothetical protein
MIERIKVGNQIDEETRNGNEKGEYGMEKEYDEVRTNRQRYI